MSTQTDTINSYIPEEYFFINATANARLVLMFLSTFKDGFFSTIQNLCLLTNLSRKTVDRALKDLFAQGFIYLDNTERDGVIKLLPEVIKNKAAANKAKAQPHLLPKRKKSKTGATQKKGTAKTGSTQKIFSENLAKMTNEVSHNLNTELVKMSNSENESIGQNVQHDWSKCPITKGDINIYTNSNIYKDLSTINNLGAQKNSAQDDSDLVLNFSEVDPAESDHQEEDQSSKQEQRKKSVRTARSSLKNKTVRRMYDGIEFLVIYDENGEVDDAHYIDEHGRLDHRPSEETIRKNSQKQNHTAALELTIRHIITNDFHLSQDEAEQLLGRMRNYYAKSGQWRFRHGNSKNVAISEKILHSIVRTWLRNDQRQRQKQITQQASCTSLPDLYGSNKQSEVIPRGVQKNFRSSSPYSPKLTEGYNPGCAPDALLHITDEQLRDEQYMAKLLTTYGSERVTRAIFGGMN